MKLRFENQVTNLIQNGGGWLYNNFYRWLKDVFKGSVVFLGFRSGGQFYGIDKVFSRFNLFSRLEDRLGGNYVETIMVFQSFQSEKQFWLKVKRVGFVGRFYFDYFKVV